MRWCGVYTCRKRKSQESRVKSQERRKRAKSAKALPVRSGKQIIQFSRDAACARSANIRWPSRIWCRFAWPFSLSGLHLVWFGYGIVYLVFFTALAVYDAKWFLLPDRLVFPLTALALSEVIVSSLWLHSWQALWQPVAGAALLFGLFWGIFQVSKGEWIGGGDVKLALALGLIAGTPLRALLVLFIASFIGTIVSLPGLLRSQKDGWTRHVPFGPYLLGGCFIIMLFADKLIGWYQRTLL